MKPILNISIGKYWIYNKKNQGKCGFLPEHSMKQNFDPEVYVCLA